MAANVAGGVARLPFDREAGVISVVIPAFNAEPSLARCLSSLRNQTAPPDEIVVVDDGSTDGTAEVARSFGVSVVRQDHLGPAVARNNGAGHARGDILLYTDADCEPESDWVEQMVRPFGDPGVAGVKGAYRTRQREAIARLAQCEFEERYDRLERFQTIDFVDTYSAAFRLDAFRAAGGFDTAFPEANNEDVELSYRLARAGHTLVFNRHAVVYHRHKAALAIVLPTQGAARILADDGLPPPPGQGRPRHLHAAKPQGADRPSAADGAARNRGPCSSLGSGTPAPHAWPCSASAACHLPGPRGTGTHACCRGCYPFWSPGRPPSWSGIATGFAGAVRFHGSTSVTPTSPVPTRSHPRMNPKCCTER